MKIENLEDAVCPVCGSVKGLTLIQRDEWIECRYCEYRIRNIFKEL
jgi:DNA-directed RNA polymerase subunit RPC12/RpoP